MKRLHLLRHAHTMPGDPLDSDHTRELSPRGHEECARLCEWWRRSGIEVELVLCSTAVRTAQTYEALRSCLAHLPEPNYQPKLYLASPPEILKVLKNAAEGAKDVLVIGHNPGLHELALILDTTHGPLLERLEQGLPTATLLTYETEAAWKDLGEAGARLARIEPA